MWEVGVQVVGWENVAIPDQRLRFWSEPEVEVGLAASTGIGILRLGVDWGRIVPTRPPLATMGASATLSVRHVALSPCMLRSPASALRPCPACCL